MEFFETSAKENINVKSVFERLVDIICDKMSENMDNETAMASGTTKGGPEFWPILGVIGTSSVGFNGVIGVSQPILTIQLYSDFH
ncbi:unnamed protein product [Protopolystoma xenopodis]|uniref:Uncharacterized protein n=1 Tax=Protopolystoma xenopodis TaxID=117903 RepID=A0A448WGG7_9PLAT|nr:unnamed protein product [Protopolystoma xenopodis]